MILQVAELQRVGAGAEGMAVALPCMLEEVTDQAALLQDKNEKGSNRQYFDDKRKDIEPCYIPFAL